MQVLNKPRRKNITYVFAFYASKKYAQLRQFMFTKISVPSIHSGVRNSLNKQTYVEYKEKKFSQYS